MLRRALPVVLAAAGLALTACSGSSLSEADRAACESLSQFGDDAIDGEPDALHLLREDLEVAGSENDPLSDELSPYAQLVAGSALLIETGADSPELAEYVGQMRGVCQTLRE